MTKTITHYFSFGSGHTSTFPKLSPFEAVADYLVRVTLPEGHETSHRELFIKHFTSVFCPRPSQFSFEYLEEHVEWRYFPKGELCSIDENGIVEHLA